MNATVISTCSGLSNVIVEPYNLAFSGMASVRLHATDGGRHVGVCMDVEEVVALRDALNDFLALTNKERS